MSQTLRISNTDEPQSVDISQSNNVQGFNLDQSENVQTISVNEKDRVQTVAITQSTDIQVFAVTQTDKTQSFGFSNDVTFMKGDTGDKGDPGFSPQVEVVEVSGGHNITFTDIDSKTSFFVPNGKDGETPEIKLGRGLYFDENGAIAVKVTDAMTENDHTPITSHGVAIQVGNMNEILKTI